MLQAHGSVEFVLRNKDTLEIEGTYTQKNMILDGLFNQILSSGRIGPMIFISNSTTPTYRFNDIINGRNVYALGYVDASSVSPLWFDANGTVPMFVQFKNRFDPPAPGSTRTISHIALTNCTSGVMTQLITYGYDTSIAYSNYSVHAGLILNTPCTQSETQVLDVFYRVQWILPVSPTIDQTHLIRSAKYYSGFGSAGDPNYTYSSPLSFAPDPTRKTVSIPYITGQYAVAYYAAFLKANAIAGTGITNDARLFKRKFTWTQGLGDDVGKIFGTYLFGAGPYDYGTITNVVTGSTVSGTTVQPVHNHSSAATVPFIDVNTLANGSGSVIPTDAGWTSASKHPELYKINIGTGGQVGTAAYNFSVRRHLGFYNNAFDNRHEVVPYFTDETLLSNYPTPLHGVVPSFGGPSDLVERFDIDTLITANASGVTKANIVTGAYMNWDANTSPALPVTNVRDIRYDSTTQTLWVACAATGLYKINMVAPYSVTKITTAPAPADSTRCYAVDFGYQNLMWVLFEGALCSSADAGVTWMAYHPASTPAFNFTGITDANYGAVRYIRCDRNAPQHQILLVRDSAAPTLPNLGSVWWSLAAPDAAAPHRYWRLVTISDQVLPSHITKTQFKATDGTVLTGTPMSSSTSTTAAAAFDQTGNTFFEANPARENNAFWVGYDFTTAVNVHSTSFVVPANSAPSSVFCTLQFSDDNVIWQTATYLGLDPAQTGDQRGFYMYPNGGTYTLLPLAWPTFGTGCALNVTARSTRFTIAPAPNSTHFICINNTNTAYFLSFGTQTGASLVNAPSGLPYMLQQVVYETDPVSGRKGLLYTAFNHANGVGSQLGSTLRTDFGDIIIPMSNQVNHPNFPIDYNQYGASILTGGYVARPVYMGKGVISYLMASSQNATVLATGQVLLNNNSIDGGPAKGIVWDSYGWNGTQWVLGNAGFKATHGTDNPLLNGINVRFADATSGASFVAGDYFNFGVNKGIFKDNATTLTGSYSFYFKPTSAGTTFSTAVVQSISGDVGAAKFYWGTRGVSLDPTGTVANTIGGSAFAKPLLFGDFEVSFTLPTNLQGGGVQFGLVNPSFGTAQNFNDPQYDVDSYNAYGYSTFSVRCKAGPSQYGLVTIMPGTVYTIKRTAGVITFLQGSTVFYTAAADNMLAFRPYVRMYGVPNSIDNPMPTINIVSNGTAFAAYVGTAAALSGYYDSNFYAFDDAALGTFNLTLNGTPSTVKYTSYQTPSIGAGEILVDGRSGVVFFSSIDAGKTVAGTYTQINNS